MELRPLSFATALALMVVIAAAAVPSVDSCAYSSDYDDLILMETDHILDIPDGWTVVPDERRAISFVDVTVAVRRRRVDFLADALAVASPQSPHYGHYWSDDRVRAAAAPLPESLAVVTEWIRAAGGWVRPSRRPDDAFVGARFAVADAEVAFGARLREFVSNGAGADGDQPRRIVRSTLHYSLPARVAEHVDFVSGLLRFPSHAATDAAAATAADFADVADVADAASVGVAADEAASGFGKDYYPAKVTPALIAQIYGIDFAGTANATNVQAVASFLDQWFSPADLALFQRTNGLSAHPVDKLVGTNTGSEPGVEAELDVQFLMGVARDIDTWVWFTPGNISGDEPFVAWLHDVSATPNPPHLFSISYQDYEDTVAAAYMDRANLEFMLLALRGVTLVTGSGDWGVGCNKAQDRFRPDFPSSSPFLVSTGGTCFESAALVEKGVTFSSGGFSDHFAQPSFQWPAVDRFLQQTSVARSFFNASGRAFPDISTIAVEFQVFVNGTVKPVGGTSAATPTFAAILSLINGRRLNAGQPTLGWVTPALYYVSETTPDAFTDVTSGQNSYGGCTGFQARSGWDPMTGFGTPNFPALAAALLSPTIFPTLRNP